MSTLCCPECFGDRGLRNNIIPSLDPGHGTCDFCGSSNVDLIQPAKLADVFEMLIGIYELDDNGKSLVEWMKEDWRIFSHENMDNAHANELLREILNDGEIVRKKFSPSETYKSEGLARWETLRDELMYNNRYFLDVDLDTDRLKELLDHLIADDLPELWYRARILTEDTPYPIDKMGAPPEAVSDPWSSKPYWNSLPLSWLTSRYCYRRDPTAYR